MTTLLKNASYLKVSHSGQTTGSLLLADLADEENAKQEKKIPVYVPEGGSITLPLDEDVLLSYQQGTIRGLEEQGYLTTSLLQSRETAEIWVAPDGDDSNAGTFSSPYATVQKAIDDLHEEYGVLVEKRVRLKIGTYTQAFYLNKVNTRVIGPEAIGSANPIGARFELDSTTGPIYVSNFTNAAIDAFQTDGGPDYTFAADSATYTGASLAGRELTDGLDNFQDMGIALENVEIDAASTTNGKDVSIVAFGRNDNAASARFQGVVLNGVEALGGTGQVWCRHLNSADFMSLRADQLVLDGCNGPSLRTALRTPLNDFNDGIYIIVTQDSYSGEAAFSTSFPIGKFDVQTEDLIIYDADGNTITGVLFDSPDISGNTNIVLNGAIDFSENFNGSIEKLGRAGSAIVVKNGASLNVHQVTCASLTIDSSANSEVGQLDCRGNVTVDGTGTQSIYNGTITGNLTVNSPATVNLTNVIIKGDLLGNGTVNRAGGGVEGSVGSFTGTDNNAALS